jgi:RNase P subunit RPR2
VKTTCLERDALKLPLCARCDAPMALKVIAPVMFAQTVDEIVFQCRSCGAEIKRAVDRSD